MNRIKLYITVFFFLILIQVQAQTAKQKNQITRTYNPTRLKSLEQAFFQKSKNEKQLALQMARQKGWKTRMTRPDGGVMELQRVVDGKPIYYTTFNLDAARSTRTNYLHSGSLGSNLMGKGMTVHVWDDGGARASHREFGGAGGANRFSMGDNSGRVTDHATHVTGTIISQGVDANAMGMAPLAKAVGYHWDADLAEATAAAANGMLISNHSYGYLTRNPDTGEVLLPQYFFGGYIAHARSWDQLMFNAPYYLMVIAAGNDGDDNSLNTNPTGGFGFDKLSGRQTAKNNLVVANAHDANVDGSGNLISVAINPSSSQGPTDDYRIKPDITGNGTDVYSSSNSISLPWWLPGVPPWGDEEEYRYQTFTGTSMASPNVAGSLLLLQEHFDNLNGSFMRSATLKGLALHTADDAGPSGPDAIFGWGLLNAKRAAETISNNGDEAKIKELTLHSGSSYTTVVEADGSKPLMASISWTDRPGTAVTTVNSTVPVLVNDLDVRISKGNTIYRPYELTGATTSAARDNNVDPFERIDVTGVSGIYTITVTHKGTLVGGSQDYTLIVTGIDHGATEIADLTFEVDNIEYEVTGLTPNTVRATDYNVTGGGLTIPQTVTHGGNNFNVTAIGDDAFANNQLTSVTLPGSVSHIGSAAFQQNKFTEIIIPSSVTHIGSWAFWGNPNLTTMETKSTNPPSININYFGAFRGEVDLVVPPGKKQAYKDSGWTGFRTISSLTAVGDQFTDGDLRYEITQPTSPHTVKVVDYTGPGGYLEIPITIQSIQNVSYSVNAIGTQAFREKGLTSVTLPDGVTSIGLRAFEQNQLESVVIPDNVTHIGTWAFRNNELSSITLGANVEHIGYGTFRFNNLTSVTLPGKVGVIRQLAFADNPIVKVTAHGVATVPAIVTDTGNTFSNRSQIDVVVPKGASITAYNNAGWTGFGSITEVPEINDTFTAENITYQITSLDPHTITATDYSVTGGTVTIPSAVVHGPNTYQVTAIGTGAFREKGLTEVTIPNGVTSIGLRAFEQNQLESVVIPDNVTHIGTWAFRNNELSSITLGANVELIGYGTFRFNDLTSVTLPGKVGEIRALAFANNPITKVTAHGVATVPTIVTDNTFLNRGQIAVVVPKGASITAYNNAGWTGFGSITLGIFTDNDIKYGITSTSPAEVDVLDYTGSTTGVTIPSTAMDNSSNTTYEVTAIGEAAFSDNELTSVTIPGSVTSIAQWAFQDNPDLALVTVEANNPPTLHADAFQNRTQIAVVVPRGTPPGSIKTAYENAWGTDFASITEGILISIVAPEQVDNLTPFSVTISFNNQNVTDFTQEKINVVNATVVDGSFSEVDGSTYTIEMRPTSCEGTITIDVPANVATGVNSSPNLAASATVTVNALPVAPTISSNSPVCSGDDAIFTITGTEGDVVTYSGALSGTATIEAGGTVEVTVNQVSSDVILTLTEVTKGSCSISLTETATVTVNALPVAPTVTNSPVCSGDDAIFTITGTEGDVVTYEGTSMGTATIEAGGTVEVTVNQVSSDASLTLTEVTKGSCSISLTETATVTVNALPSAPTLSTNSPVCSGDDAIFTITGTEGDVVTYSGALSGTATIEAGGTVEVTVNQVSSDVTLDLTEVTNGSCSVPLTETATVTVNALPSAPTLSTNSPVCSNEDAVFTITGTAGDVVTYHDGASTATATLGTDGTATVTVNGVSSDVTLNLTEITNGSCGVSLTETATVTVNALPVAPTISSNSPVCSGDDAIFTITGTEGDVVTYGGTSIGTATIGTDGKATVTVSGVSSNVILNLTKVSNGNCDVSLTETATVTVNALPQAPTISSNSPVCSGGDAVFTITGTEGDVVTYSGAVSGTATIEAGGTVDVTVNGVSSDATLNLTGVTNGNCSVSLTETATVTVNALPVAPTISSNSPVCSGDDAIFTITGTEGDVVTYSGALSGEVTIEAGGTVEVTVNQVSLDVILTLTEVTKGSCSISLTETATVTVNALPVAPTISSNSPVCSGDDAIFTITGTEGDVVTYSGALSGTAIIEAGGTVEVTVNQVSSDASLTLTEVTKGSCSISLTETATVTVNALPVAPTISLNSPVCSGDDAIFTITGTAGDVVTYEGTSMGTATIEADGTVEVTVNQVSSDASLTLTEVTKGSCSISLTETATVTVNALPSAPTLSTNSPVCSGDDAIFAITGTAGDVVTYDDGTSTKTATIEADGTVDVTVSGVSSDVTLTLTKVSNGNCDVLLTATATVTVNAIPSAPSVSSSPMKYCVDETATALTANGTDLLWYTTATGGTGTPTAPIPNTATAGSTSYYVSQTTNGCESQRAKIVVTVEACPAQIGDVFTVSDMKYEITSVTPNEVKIMDYIGSATAIEIPETVDDKGETYTVTAIGANAFSDNSDLTTVKIETDHPPSLHEDAFADRRSQINLIVPAGTREDYLKAGWTGFKSISDGTIVSIGEPEKDNIILYPNPARDKVYIDIDPRSGQELKQVNIYTMTGAYLYSESGLEINTGRLSEGLYLFEIVTKTGNRSMKKIVIADR